jgi:hypothetical protein
LKFGVMRAQLALAVEHFIETIVGLVILDHISDRPSLFERRGQIQTSLAAKTGLAARQAKRFHPRLSRGFSVFGCHSPAALPA